MTKKISKPTPATRRRILAHSGNQCAFPTLLLSVPTIWRLSTKDLST